MIGMNICIKGYYGYKNLGDDYILCSILSSLEKISETINSVSVFSHDDDYSHIFMLFPKLTCGIIKSKNSKITHAIKDEVMILGGGGIFIKDDWREFIKVLFIFITRKVLGNRNVIYGVDLSKLDKAISKLIWRLIAGVSDIITVRNDYSEQLLERAGITDKLFSYPDITYCLNDKCVTNDKILNLLGVLDEPYVIVVLARPWDEEDTAKNENHALRYDRLKAQMANLCNRCSADGYKILFVPFYHKNDRKFICELEPLLQGEYSIVEESGINIEDKRPLFANAKACISMRFHGIAFSLYYGIPCEAICYAPKSTELMKECNLGDYGIKYGINKENSFYSEFDMEDGDLNRIYNNLWTDECRERFRNASYQLKEKAQDGEKRLLDVLKNDFV